MKELSIQGFEHDEISNWSKPGFSCRHNWLYWSGDNYIGIGTGAHGFSDGGINDIGIRYSYTKELRVFLREFSAGKKDFGIEFDSNRDSQSWLFEYVGCGMRTREGIDLDLIESKNFEFLPNSVIKTAISNGKIILTNQRLSLEPKEWFREISWSGLVLNCFRNTNN